MSFQRNNVDEETGVVNYSAPGQLNIYECQALRTDLLALLDAHNSLAIDLSEVTEFDTAGVQILIAARKEAEAKRKVLVYQSPSPAVSELLELYALGETLGVGPGGKG